MAPSACGGWWGRVEVLNQFLGQRGQRAEHRGRDHRQRRVGAQPGDEIVGRNADGAAEAVMAQGMLWRVQRSSQRPFAQPCDRGWMPVTGWPSRTSSWKRLMIAKRRCSPSSCWRRLCARRRVVTLMVVAP